MTKARLEAFSDGVLAIVITITVLGLKDPAGTEVGSLIPVVPYFLTYLLSFIYIGIYWNNHHHLLHAATQINGRVMWANLHFLFWLSLIPYMTGWMGENHFEEVPTAFYGIVLLMTSVAYMILQCTIIAEEGQDSKLAKAVGRDWKGRVSVALYAAAISLTILNHRVSQMVYVVVAMIWFIPDRRIEKMEPL